MKWIRYYFLTSLNGIELIAMSSSVKRPGEQLVGFEPPTKKDALKKSTGECSTDQGNKDDTSEEVSVELADKQMIFLEPTL